MESAETVTFLFTDIEGSTRLLRKLGDRRYSEVLAEHRKILRAAITASAGQEVDTEGDGFFVAFHAAKDAIQAALVAQRALKAHIWPAGAVLQVRMGLHTGVPIAAESGYVGVGVHRASRICRVGHGGQILLSQTTAHMVEGDLPEGVRLRDIGEYRLKDMPHRERIFQLVAPGLAQTFPAIRALSTRASRLRAAAGFAAVLLLAGIAFVLIQTNGAGAPKIDSLAVLPMKNLMRDSKQEYFVEGMHEALITELSKISALKVISRTSAIRYKDTDKPLQQVARELGVEALLEGSVLREGSQVRITMQLVHGPTDRHLWAQSFDRELRGILALHSDIAQAVAREIRVKLKPQEKALLSAAPLVNPEAYQAYLKGLYYRNRWPAPEFARCEEHFRQAIEIQSDYAGAYSGLAGCYETMPWTYSPGDVYPLAREAAQKALELDPTQAEAYSSLASVNLFFEWNWAAAKQNYRRALELRPNSVNAHLWHSNYFVFTGRFEDAIQEAKEAVALDPVSLLMNRNLSFVYLLARKYKDYAAQSRATLELAPENLLAKFDLAWAYALQGMRKEAEKALAELNEGAFPLGAAIVRATLGDRERALRLVEQMKQQEAIDKRKAATLPGVRRDRKEYADPFWFGVLYAGLGESGKALLLLNQGYEERSASMVQLKTNPGLDPLRSHQLFQDLLRRMKFPE